MPNLLYAVPSTNPSNIEKIQRKINFWERWELSPGLLGEKEDPPSKKKKITFCPEKIAILCGKQEHTSGRSLRQPSHDIQPGEI